MSYASRDHRRLDAAAAEAQARDGGERVGGGPAVQSRDRGRDARTLTSSARRVLLTSLSAKTSAKGRTYLSGFLGKATVVAFEGAPDRFGNPTWDVFLSEPRQAAGSSEKGFRSGSPSGRNANASTGTGARR